jgi:hypothetical protein
LEELPSCIGQLNALQKLIYKTSTTWKWKASWKKCIHPWANWMHTKCFICQSVRIWNNYFHLLVIECTWKSWFVWMFQLAIMIYMYIGQLNALQKL